MKLAIKYLMSFLLDGSTHQGQMDIRIGKCKDRLNWTSQRRQTKTADEKCCNLFYLYLFFLLNRKEAEDILNKARWFTNNFCFMVNYFVTIWNVLSMLKMSMLVFWVLTSCGLLGRQTSRYKQRIWRVGNIRTLGTW